MISMKRSGILVTGGAGYIGSHVVWQLREAGYQVIVLDNLSTGDERNCPSDVPLIRGEAADTELVKKLTSAHKIGSVIHFAGSIQVEESLADPLKYYQNNTAVTMRLLDACKQNEISQFIFSSTAAVYGEPTDRSEQAIDEFAPTCPASPYGASKLMSEQIISDYANASKLRYVCLRYFNVAGAHPSLRSGQRGTRATHLIKRACETAVGLHANLDVFGVDYDTADGTCVRDYIHVSDLASAHLHALHYLDGSGKSVTLNCGYGIGHSVLEVIEKVRSLSGCRIPVIKQPRRPGDVQRLVAETSLIKRTLPQWRSKFNTLTAIVGSALAWEKSLRPAERLKTAPIPPTRPTLSYKSGNNRDGEVVT